MSACSGSQHVIRANPPFPSLGPPCGSLPAGSSASIGHRPNTGTSVGTPRDSTPRNHPWNRPLGVATSELPPRSCHLGVATSELPSWSCPLAPPWTAPAGDVRYPFFGRIPTHEKVCPCRGPPFRSRAPSVRRRTNPCGSTEPGKSATKYRIFRYAPHIGKLPLAAALSPTL